VRIIVLGGGVAGIRTACQLQRGGHEVVIVEGGFQSVHARAATSKLREERPFNDDGA
jgi:glycine/D-amino acid oxidase-like deaminating enzyme